MGGAGSGSGIRFNTRRKKRFVEECQSIDTLSFPYRLMRNLPKHGLKCVLHSCCLRIFQDHLETIYQQGGETWTQEIKFLFSQEHFGNFRYWFRCPSHKCLRRCRKLFLRHSSCGAPVFLCRRCLFLAYRSQNKSFWDRIITKRWNLIRKLGTDSDWIRERPKGMHWKTFERLKMKLSELDIE